MPRRFLRRLSVAYREKHEQQPWYLRPFASLLDHPVYLSINRRSISKAVAIGLFVAMLPMPGHTPLALLLGLLLRANLPVALLAIWVVNPLTLAPILYGEYLLGNYLLGVTPGDFSLGSSWAEMRTLMAREPGVRCGSVRLSADCCSPCSVMALPMRPGGPIPCGVTRRRIEERNRRS